jgi:hypothetical protein
MASSVSHIRQVGLFVFSLYGITLCQSNYQFWNTVLELVTHTSVDHCILGHYIELRWIGHDNFELDSLHATWTKVSPLRMGRYAERAVSNSKKSVQVQL